MLFWTLVLIAFTIIKLIKGGFFKEVIVNVAELTVKQYNPETSEKEKKALQEEVLKVSWVYLLFGLVTVIVHIVYLLNAIELDPLKYPTLIMIAWVMLAFIKGVVTKKMDLSIEQNRKIYLSKAYLLNKRTLQGTIKNLLFLSYFGYMFYLSILI